MTASPADDAWSTARKMAWIEQLARDPGLSALALRLALILAAKYVNRATGEAWPGQETLSDDIGGTLDGLRKAARQLEERGHLAVARSPGRGKSNRYRPLILVEADAENPRRVFGFSDGKPPTRVRVFAAAEGRKPPTPVGETPDARPLKPPTGGGVNPLKEPLEEPMRRKAEKPPPIGEHVEAIWRAASPVGRKRSSRREVEAALSAALKAGHGAADVLTGVAGYYASRDATKDGGQYGMGCHLVVKRDRWQAFLPAPPSEPAGAPVDPWRARVKAFADPAVRYWNATDWGPKPGKPGCEAPAAILAEFGFRGETVVPLRRGAA